MIKRPNVEKKPSPRAHVADPLYETLPDANFFSVVQHPNGSSKNDQKNVYPHFTRPPFQTILSALFASTFSSSEPARTHPFSVSILVMNCLL